MEGETGWVRRREESGEERGTDYDLGQVRKGMQGRLVREKSNILLLAFLLLFPPLSSRFLSMACAIPGVHMAMKD